MTTQPDRITIPLWRTPAPGAIGTADDDVPALTLYPPDPADATGGAVIILPGGGYGGLADHEGRPVAEWLNAHGIFAAVLRYRLGPRYRHPVMMNDASRAIRLLRHSAADYAIDPRKVGILGFSAGGHLASTVSVHFDAGDPVAADPIERVACRPDVSILIYPVLALSGEYAHVGSRINLLGDEANPNMVALLSTHDHVSASTPPTFLVTANDDEAVPLENSFQYALALSKARVPFELHAYQSGGHGFGLGADDPVLSRWPHDCAAWLRRYGF